MDEERVCTFFYCSLPFLLFTLEWHLQARREREAEEARKEQERAAREEEELNNQIKADAMRQMIAREQLQHRTRKRANSESTEVPALSGDTPMESFGKEIVVDGVSFTTVKLFHARTGSSAYIFRSQSFFKLILFLFPRGARNGVHG